ncbi:hypothetical protein [Rhodococcus sp. PSBB066]|nr:hypothetical protein [Rhodococcus sp. PSBB066]QSE62416.1 hypothetical protein JYA75_28410 [Rhodococcus sp. PSBB066]
MESTTLARPKGEISQNLSLSQGKAIRFGRGHRCELQFAGDDKAVSRTSGAIVHVGSSGPEGRVELYNTSKWAWLFVSQPSGFSASLPPKSSFVVTERSTRIIMLGNTGVHTIGILIPEVMLHRSFSESPHSNTSNWYDEEETNLAQAHRQLSEEFTPAERCILNAVFEQYFTPKPMPMPRPHGTPKAVAEALSTNPTIRNHYPNWDKMAPATTEREIAKAIEKALDIASEYRIPGVHDEDVYNTFLSHIKADRTPLAKDRRLHALALFLLGSEIIPYYED